MRVTGRARDLLTPVESPSVAIAEDSFVADVDRHWAITSITAEPGRPQLGQLTGSRITRGFRKALASALPDPDSPLALALTDLIGASLVAGAAWQSWDPDWMSKTFGDVPLENLLEARRDVCIGHAAGSSAQDPNLAPDLDERPEAADPVDPDDPGGWHVLPPLEGVAFRRTRRFDVEAAGVVRIDAEFQDSATTPSGRVAIHEYGLTVTADLLSLEVQDIRTDPRVLPYRECPAVSASLPRLVGVKLHDLREAVPAALRGAAGCTHLNEALIALSVVPGLLRHLD